jgi:hypothetical protein
MASEVGRGAQVRLDDTARALARGGAGLRLIDSIRQKQALEAAGTAPDGNTPDGSLGNGTAADDEVLLPGGDGSGINTNFIPPGTGSTTRPVPVKLAELPLSSADYGTADALRTAAASVLYKPVAWRTQFQGPDQAPQFEVGWTPASVNAFRVVGGITGAAPGLVAWSETDTNVTASYAAKGTGGHAFGNGAGPLFNVKDRGDNIETSTVLSVKPAAALGTAQLAVEVLRGEASGGLALTPWGTGALTAQYPDSTTAGGNARGTYAVDWSMFRTSNSAVASGAYSTVGGGRTNTASGSEAVVAGGSRHTALGTACTISGGDFNFHTGSYGWISGGQMAHGRGRTGFGCWASGGFSGSSAGEAQAGEMVLRRASTDGAAQRLASDGASTSAATQFTLPNNSAAMVRILVAARQTAGASGTVGDTAMWVVEQGVKRGANAAATVLISGGASTAPSVADAGATGWRVQCLADTTNGALAVNVTGEASKNISWVARMMTVEVAG